MKKLIYVFAILLCFLFVGKLFALNDSCLTLYCPNDGVNYNPDYICIDTCKESPTFGDWFQSGTWTIGFKRFFLRDSVDFVKYGKTAQLKDIDSVNFPEVYSAFKIMEKKFGVITLERDNYACVHYSDSSYYQEPCLNIFFNRQNRTKDVEYYLNQLPEIRFVRMTNYPLKSDIHSSCLTLIWPENGDSYNPDMVKKDTCKDSPTYGEWFQKGDWLMGMKEYIFNRLIPKSSSAFIEDIDTVKYKSVKDGFQILEKKFGKIRFFRDWIECSNRDDKAFVIYPCLDIDFPRYNLSSEVLQELNNQPISKVTFLKRRPRPSEVEENNIGLLELKPNPCYDQLTLYNIGNKTNYRTKIEIYNSLGLRTGFYEFSNELNETEIDISNLSIGIYLLRINEKTYKFSVVR